MIRIARQIMLMVVCMFLYGYICAQDTILLKEIHIYEKSYAVSAGMKSTTIDSVAITVSEHSDLAGLLSRYSPVFVKSYGPGALASSSMRGAGASQVQVLWNGMNINNPMLGQTDFSGIPALICDEVNIYHGSGNITENSGAFGGSIHLDNTPDWNNRYKITAGTAYGSFSTISGNVSLKAGNSKFQSNTILYGLDSENDFTFRDYTQANNTVSTRTGADFYNRGFMQEAHWKTSSSATLSARIWSMSNHRNLPAVLGTPKDELSDYKEDQSDNSIRTVIDWDQRSDNLIYNIKSSYQAIGINYNNLQQNICSDSRVQTFFNKAVFRILPQKIISVTTGISHSYSKALTENYESDKFRNHTSAFARLNGRCFKKRIKFSIANRCDLVDGIPEYILPAAGIELSPSLRSRLWISSYVSRNVHYPTLNDLYWNPGGNSMLHPEENIAEEFSLHARHLKGKFKINGSFTCYFSQNENWIVWLPESSGIWSPVNVKSVEAKGMEAEYSASLDLPGGTTISMFSQYNRTISTNRSSFSGTDDSYGKQLIYIPINQANASVFFVYKNIRADWHYSYTDKRYITTDNSGYLPSFMISDAGLSWSIYLNESVITARIAVNNLFDESYIPVAGYPVPGRNYLLSLKYQFDKKK